MPASGPLPWKYDASRGARPVARAGSGAGQARRAPSDALEFNNIFASCKGKWTGAVRHMFSHHILKPERMPIEANPWGTPKSSGAFSSLYKSRLLRSLTEMDSRCPHPLSRAHAFAGTSFAGMTTS